jgi:uncharacterized protein (TIGR00369 family)
MTKAVRYGVATPAEAAELTGREFLQAIIDGRLPQPPISATLGFALTEVGDGIAVFEGEPSPALFNPLGTVHGGWALTLIDSAAGCAAHTTLDKGILYTTVETKVNFSRAIMPDTGRVRAEGTVISRGRQIITTEARVLSKDRRILAHGTSTLLVLGPRR